MYKRQVLGQKEYNIGGPVKVLSQGEFPEKFPGVYMTPAQLREKMDERGWQKAVSYTHLQVENGVSARISSIRNHEGPVDLIAEQIRIGLGEPLGYTQDDVTFDGVGIEYRLIAEDPEHGFTPWVGRIERFAWKEEPWLTMLTHVPTDTPYEIPTEFDPNLALAIIWGKDLAEARERGVSFLDNLHLEGRNNAGEALKSNVDFLRANTARTLRF